MSNKIDSAFLSLLSVINLGLSWYFQAHLYTWSALMFFAIGILLGYAAFRTYQGKSSGATSFITRHRNDMEKMNRPFMIILTVLSVLAITVFYITIPILQEVLEKMGTGGLFFHLITSTYKFYFVIALIPVMLAIMYFRTSREEYQKRAKIFFYIQVTNIAIILLLVLVSVGMFFSMSYK